MTQTDKNAGHDASEHSRPDSTSRRGWLLGALGAGLAAAVVITAVVVASDSNDDGTPIAGSPSDTLAPSDGGPTGAEGGEPTVGEMHQGTFDPANNTFATMYYLGAENARTGDVFLFAEPHTVEQSDPTSRIHEFLTSRPIDPDYRSGWPEGVDVSAVESGGDSATIALFGEATIESAGDLGKRAAEIAIQGLIRTAGVTSGTVSFTYNDEPLRTLLGVNVASGVAVQPEQSGDFAVITRAAVQVTSPVEGQVMSSPVLITGNGNVFEGTVNWQLLDKAGSEIDSGFVTAAFAEWGDFEIKLGTLDPGSYTFRALEYSAEDGSEMNVDDKSFTVE